MPHDYIERIIQAGAKVDVDWVRWHSMREHMTSERFTVFMADFASRRSKWSSLVNLMMEANQRGDDALFAVTFSAARASKPDYGRSFV